MSIEKAIQIAAASVEMEGFQIDEKSREWRQQLLKGDQLNLPSDVNT